MSFDSEDKRSDFAKWAEEMSYEEEKELKRQEKLELKEKKKAEKAAKKAAKLAKNTSDDSGDNSEAKTSADTESVTGTAETSVIADKTSGISEMSADSETVSDASSEGDAEESDKKKKEKEAYNPDYKKEKKKKDKEEINIVKELFSLIIYIGIIIIICYLIINYVGQRTTVNGHSMETTLQDGDNLWIDKISYRFKDPQRFDIIVFPYEEEKEVYYIKRIIGLPGETVQISPEGNIFIDGEILKESYGKEIIADSGTAGEAHTLGDDEYFVLGDNRNGSRDSRWADVGDISRSKIIGKAVFRLSPFDNFGKIE